MSNRDRSYRLDVDVLFCLRHFSGILLAARFPPEGEVQPAPLRHSIHSQPAPLLIPRLHVMLLHPPD